MSAALENRGFTKHASVRVQQRSVPPIVVEFLLDYGLRQSAPGGGERFSFCKRAWRRLQRELGPAAKHFERYRHVYAVVCDGHVVTVAYAH
jgi:hypothetical protein